MKMLVFTGIIGYEKTQFAMRVASALQEARLRVEIIDARDYAPMPRVDGVITHYFRGNFDEDLYNKVHRIMCDVVLLVTDESVHPEALAATLGHLADIVPSLEITSVALIDNRTCDCFPNLRVMLEDYADITLYAPFDIAEIVGVLLYDR